MPSITKIQQLIENAWRNGFDLQGKAQLGGCLKATAKWIGASDVCAMFSALRVRCVVVVLVHKLRIVFFHLIEQVII